MTGVTPIFKIVGGNLSNKLAMIVLILKSFSRGIWGWLYISCTMLGSPYIIFLSGHFMYRVFHHVEHCFADIQLGLFWPPKNLNFGVTPVIETYKNYNTWGAGLVEIRGSIRTLSVLPTLLRYLGFNTGIILPTYPASFTKVSRI